MKATGFLLNFTVGEVWALRKMLVKSFAFVLCRVVEDYTDLVWLLASVWRTVDLSEKRYDHSSTKERQTH